MVCVPPGRLVFWQVVLELLLKRIDIIFDIILVITDRLFNAVNEAIISHLFERVVEIPVIVAAIRISLTNKWMATLNVW